MEHRWGERSTVWVETRLLLSGCVASERGCILDISASGAFIENRLKAQLLQRIEVEIAMRSYADSELIRVPACIVRRTAVGVGVEWCERLPFAISELAAPLPLRPRPAAIASL
jgi:hypothetical protein